MDFVTRINLKTGCENRGDLINFCLNSDKQYIVIGWSCVYDDKKSIHDYETYYYAVKDYVKANGKKINSALNVLWYVTEGDLFWTRDLEGYYWICRALGKAESMRNEKLDIGAGVSVEAYCVGMEVPGQIKASFNRPRGGITDRIKDEIIISYSRNIFNIVSGRNEYDVIKIEGDFLDNLPDFDLEELIIAYLQIEKDYYVLSNSIANKSTTIKIECELMSRNTDDIKKAVVQVKGGKTKSINAMDFKSYSDDGYYVYLYAPHIDNLDSIKNCIEITREEVRKFYFNNKRILPDSITKWENIFEM